MLLAVAVAPELTAQTGPPAPAPPGVRVPSGQDPDTVLFDEAVKRLQGRPVRTVQLVDVTADPRGRLVETAAAAPILRSLETRAGRPFEARSVSSDCANLWHERRLVVAGFVQEAGAEVVVTFRIERRVETYAGVEFRGLEHFDRATVDSLLGLASARQVTSTEAEAMRKVLIARYRRDGYAFCGIELQERVADELRDDASEPADRRGPADRASRRLRFQVDEGPKVTVRDVHVLGNASYPAEPALGWIGTGDYLLRESGIESDPAWWIGRGGAFSREVIDEDLDRLRVFYRSRGFLDATVDLADVVFSDDRTEVDLTLLVVEGPRYRIARVRVEHVDARGEPLQQPPRYAGPEIEQELQTAPGEFYDHRKLQRDWLAIQEFYGRRGHPPSTFPGMEKDPAACVVRFPPREIYGAGAEVEIVFQVHEGVPKKLRDVVIRGNQHTRDAVIRRRVRAKPGEPIDMRDVDRSLRNLQQSRYFTDPTSLRGPRLQFEPVPGAADELDLAVDLEDGETGEFRWGVGISTGQGAMASITFRKRNFDLWNLPSSPNPVTAIGEMLDSRAFHGGGQTLDINLAPGNRMSTFRVQWTEPDVFGEHYDTHELRVAGHRSIRRLPDGYTSDTLGAELGLSRNFTDEFNAGLSLRHDTVEVDDLQPDATSLAYAAEGKTELRGLRLSARYRDQDDLLRPTEGFELALNAEMVGGFLGGEQSFGKLTHTAHFYLPLRENESGHRTVLHFEHFFGVAGAFGGSDDVFLTERFYMGGGNLRGFDFRGAGPSQFTRPYGGEAMYTATLELGFPLVATRLEHEIRDRELLRWVAFSDVGLLGLSIDDPTFGQLRGSFGIGLRIEVPMLELPIALDLAWPWRFEESDDRRQFFFSIAR